MRTLIMLYTALLLTNCSYEPKEPGLCKLNCSKAIISGNEANIKFKLSTSTQAIACGPEAAGQTIDEPVMVQYVLAEEFGEAPATNLRPIPSISFEPIVNGLRSELREHNPNVVITSDANGDIFTPARYKGIVTLADNWCTDSCGVATLEVFPRCPPVGTSSDVTIQVHSGALYSDVATFNVSTIEPASN